MRTVKVIGLVVAVLGLLTAIIAFLTEGLKLYRELPIQMPKTVTSIATLPESPQNSSSTTQALDNYQQDQCQWLQTNFPQSANDAKAKYSIPSDTTFQFIDELCPSTANAFSFKAKSTVEIQVPSGGCIDSWAGFTEYVGDVGTPVSDNRGGWRVYKGAVRAPEMTIRILGCK